MNQKKTTIGKIVHVLRWVENLNGGEMIESPGYTREYFDFGQINSNEFEKIVAVVNAVLENTKSKFLVGRQLCGTIIPVRNIKIKTPKTLSKTLSMKAEEIARMKESYEMIECPEVVEEKKIQYAVSHDDGTDCTVFLFDSKMNKVFQKEI